MLMVTLPDKALLTFFRLSCLSCQLGMEGAEEEARVVQNGHLDAKLMCGFPVRHVRLIRSRETAVRMGHAIT